MPDSTVKYFDRVKSAKRREYATRLRAKGVNERRIFGLTLRKYP